MGLFKFQYNSFKRLNTIYLRDSHQRIFHSKHSAIVVSDKYALNGSKTNSLLLSIIVSGPKNRGACTFIDMSIDSNHDFQANDLQEGSKDLVCYSTSNPISSP